MDQNQENNQSSHSGMSLSRDDEQKVPDSHQAALHRKHSGLGIASTTMAVTAIVSTIVLLVMLINIFSTVDLEFIANQDPEELEEQVLELFENNPQLPLVLTSFTFVAGMLVIGGILGLVGFLRKGRKKLFIHLGITLNSIGVSLIIFIGLLSFFM